MCARPCPRGSSNCFIFVHNTAHTLITILSRHIHIHTHTHTPPPHTHTTQERAAARRLASCDADTILPSYSELQESSSSSRSTLGMLRSNPFKSALAGRRSSSQGGGGSARVLSAADTSMSGHTGIVISVDGVEVCLRVPSPW